MDAVKLDITLTVKEDFAQNLAKLKAITESQDWDGDIFALLCFAIANDETQVYFDYDETIINIHYEEVEE